MKLSVINGSYSILRYQPNTQIPSWLSESYFYSVGKTPEELSIVCESHLIKNGYEEKEDGWKLLKVEGPLDFSLTGILSSISTPLAEAKISIFAVSTFDTDYLLVKNESLEPAKATLQQAGFDLV